MSVIARKLMTLSRMLPLLLVDALVALSARKRSGNKLLLVRVDAIGDYVLFRNFIKYLRESRYGQYQITLCGNVLWQELSTTFDASYLDDFIWIDRSKLVSDYGYRYSMLKKIRSAGFEVAIQPSISREYFYCESIIRSAAAGTNIGNSGDCVNMSRVAKFFSDRIYHRLLTAAAPSSFEFDNNKRFFEELLQEEIDLERPRLDRTKLPELQCPAKPFAVIFPGASEQGKQWATRNFARIVEFLWAEFGCSAVIAGAPKDRYLAQEITRYCSVPAGITDWTGRTTLSELAKLISESAILVSNDTSAVHLAAALGTKTVCISSGKHYGKCHPYPEQLCNDMRFLYPEVITSSLNRGETGVLQRYHSTGYDIDSVPASLVQHHIRALLAEAS